MSYNTKEKSKTAAFHRIKDIAERWHTSDRFVRREIYAGRLVAHRFGRSLRVSDEDLHVYERLRRGQ